MSMKIDIKVGGKIVATGIVSNVSAPFDPEAEYADYDMYLRYGKGSHRTFWHLYSIRRKPYNPWKFLQDVLEGIDFEEVEP